MNHEGRITVRCGVVNYERTLIGFKGEENVPDTAMWIDYFNKLLWGMGFDMGVSHLMAEETVTVHIPKARQKPETMSCRRTPSELDGRFFEIDVTEQVNWILANHGQYAIVFLVKPDSTLGEYGKVHVFGYENMDVFSLKYTGEHWNNSEHPWTTDGNTVHLVVESGNLGIAQGSPIPAAGNQALMTFNTPNPFKARTRLHYYTGTDHHGVLTVYNADGQRVLKRVISGSGSIVWNAKDRASGIYICRLSTNSQTAYKRMLLVK